MTIRRAPIGQARSRPRTRDRSRRGATLAVTGALCIAALTGARAQGRTLCAIAGQPAELPDPCRTSHVERLDLTRLTSVPVSVPLGGAAEAVDLHLVDDSGARLYRIRAAASDPDAASVDHVPFESRAALTRVSGETAGNYRPIWHPNGRYLVWRQDDNPPRLWCMDLERSGQPPTAIEFPQAGDTGLFGGQADGISTYRWHPERTELWVRLTRSDRLRRVTLAGCRPRITEAEGLPPVDDFSISPDGRLLTVRAPGTEDLRLTTLEGEERGPLCGAGASLPELKTAICRDVRWHPESRQLVFWRSVPDVPGSQRIIAAEIDDGRVGRVTAVGPEREAPRPGRRPARPALGARYSPDGGHLAFVSDGGLYVVSTDALFEAQAAPRPLSAAQGAYDGSHSSPAWLGPHHVAAVIEAMGNHHPIVVTPITPSGRSPTLLSTAFPDHHDLAYDPHQGLLAMSAFDGQQGIFVHRLQTRRPPGARAITHTVRIETHGRPPDELAARSAVLDLEPRARLRIAWASRPAAQRLDLVLTLEPGRNTP